MPHRSTNALKKPATSLQEEPGRPRPDFSGRGRPGSSTKKHTTAKTFPHAAPPPFLTRVQWDNLIESLCLTPQQARVVAAILRGMRDKQIALDMEISRHTVRTHLRRIFANLNIADRLELVLLITAQCQSKARPRNV